MFVVELTNFSLKKSQWDISLQLILRYWFSIGQTKLFEVMIVLEYKNDTNTPSVLGMWSWLEQRGKDPGKRQQHSLISIFFYL